MILSELYQHLKTELLASGIETADLDARIMIETRLGYSWADIMAKPDAVIEEDELMKDLERRLAGEPLSKIYGEKEFWGRRFKVTEDTLDPRPDTELIVERTLQGAAPGAILDLGTGTGCLMITLLLEYPQATGVAVDVSADALKIAKENAKTHGVLDRCDFVQSNWAEKIENEFDLVVSNPPYIPNPDIESLGIAVKKFDPILALDGGEDGLDAYKNIFSDLFRLLKLGGKALFEIGFDQEVKVTRLAEESGLLVVGKFADIAGLTRVVEIALKNASGDK